MLVNGWLTEDGEPTIDWASTISGELNDQGAADRSLPLGAVIERISRDLENQIEDPAYGVGAVTNAATPADDHTVRDLMINALGGIAAALGSKAIGL